MSVWREEREKWKVESWKKYEWIFFMNDFKRRSDRANVLRGCVCVCWVGGHVCERTHRKLRNSSSFFLYKQSSCRWDSCKSWVFFSAEDSVSVRGFFNIVHEITDKHHIGLWTALCDRQFEQNWLKLFYWKFTFTQFFLTICFPIDTFYSCSFFFCNDRLKKSPLTIKRKKVQKGRWPEFDEVNLVRPNVPGMKSDRGVFTRLSRQSPSGIVCR